MKILLSSANFCQDPYIVYPLGMSVVASALTAAGHRIAQFDPLVAGRAFFAEKLAALIADFRPDAIGISVRNLDHVDSNSKCGGRILSDLLLLVKLFRRDAPGIPLVLGGAGFSVSPKRILELAGADYGIVGEGESAAIHLFDSLEKGVAPARGSMIGMPSVRAYPPLYDKAICDYYLEHTHILNVQTKRGCPFRCVYCTYPALEGRVLRPRNPDEVVDDLFYITQNHPDALVGFVDSVFNDPERHFERLLERMRARKCSVKWTAFLTPGGMSDGDVGLMAENGLVAADLGLDGASDAALAGLKKNFSFAEAKSCCKKLLARKVAVSASVMFGGPGETDRTVREGISNLLSLEGVYSVVFSGIRLFEGAPLLELARKDGKVPESWNGTDSLYYYADGIEPQKLDAMLREGFRGSRCCVYPPDARNEEIRMIHRFGYMRLRSLRNSPE